MITDNRKQLGRAIDRLATVEREYEQLGSALMRAEAHLASATAKLGSYDDLPERLAKFYADSMERGESPLNLPEELSQLKTQAAETADLVSAAKGGITHLRGKIEAASSEVARIKAWRDALAVAVMYDELASAAAELCAINERRWQLRTLLNARLPNHLGGTLVAPAITKSIHDAMEEGGGLIPHPGHDWHPESVTRRMRAFFDAVRLDADAQLTISAVSATGR